MPRPAQLSSVPTEALVEELKRRFAEVDRAKKLLMGMPAVSSTGSARKRGGTSEYAQQVSSLVQSIRHAKRRKESTAALEKQLDKLRASHRG